MEASQFLLLPPLMNWVGSQLSTVSPQDPEGASALGAGVPGWWAELWSGNGLREATEAAEGIGQNQDSQRRGAPDPEWCPDVRAPTSRGERAVVERGSLPT